MARQINRRELRKRRGELLLRHRFTRAETAVAAFRGALDIDFGRFRADLDRAAGQDIAPRG